MLSLAGRMISRSKPMRSVSTNRFYNPLQKIPCKTLEPLRISNSLNPNVGTRFMSSWTPPPPPQVNKPLDDSASDSSWEGSTLDPGPIIRVDDVDTPWIESAPYQDTVVAAVPTLQDLGLGSHTPVGLFQIILDTLHSAGLPWWSTIVVSTIVLRAAVFPLVLRSQRATPEYLAQMLKMRTAAELMTESRGMENPQDAERKAAEAAQTFAEFQKNYPRVMARQMLPLFTQSPIFISFFLATSNMAWAPVESMKTGGALWFSDLTIADPLYLLPVITCGTLSVIIEIGADTNIRADQMPGLTTFMRIVPLLMVPLIMSYPAATLCYWSTNNFISLCQVYLLRIPEVREKLNLPPMSAMTTSLGGFSTLRGKK